MGTQRNKRQLTNAGFPECTEALKTLWSKYPKDTYPQLEHYYSVAAALDTDVLRIAKTMTQMMMAEEHEYYKAPDETLDIA